MFDNCAYLLLCSVDASADERLVRWVNCAPLESQDFIRIFEDDQRIEVIRDGAYRLHLNLEADEGGDANYFLEVNGCPATMCKQKELRESTGSASPSAPQGNRTATPTATGGEKEEAQSSNAGVESVVKPKSFVPLNVALIAQLHLDKWDLVVLRREHLNRDAPGYLSFGRLILEPLAEKERDAN